MLNYIFDGNIEKAATFLADTIPLLKVPYVFFNEKRFEEETQPILVWDKKHKVEHDVKTLFVTMINKICDRLKEKDDPSNKTKIEFFIKPALEKDEKLAKQLMKDLDVRAVDLDEDTRKLLGILPEKGQGAYNKLPNK